MRDVEIHLFFFNDTATTEIYTLSLHDALPISRAVEASLRLVHAGGRDGDPQVFEREPVRGERRGIRLDPDGRLLAAADAHDADARYLRDLLREARIRQVFHAGERERVGGERERQDRRVGGIRLAVRGWRREVHREERLRGVDGLLYLLLGHVDVQAEHELERDDGAAAGAGGRHLLEAGHLPELPLQRGRHRRRHDVRDRKSTRLNSSHLVISYAVFCLKKKKKSTISDTSVFI